MKIPENPQESRTELWQTFSGLPRLLKTLDDTDEGAHSLRAAKYVRSFVHDKNEALLGVLDSALNHEGYSFTFFETIDAPGEVVEPLFEALVAAPEPKRLECARALVRELDSWEANNLPEYRLAA